MKKIMLVIANYNDQRQEIFDKYYSPRNKEYCQKHGYEYVLSSGGEKFRNNPTWWKFTIPQQMIQRGDLRDGDCLLHLDADMIIHKTEYAYPCEKAFTYAIDNGNSHCMGNYSMKIDEFSRNIISNILNENLWNLCKNTEFWNFWREQAAWYTLTGVQRHSWIDFRKLPNNGFHSTQDSFFRPIIKYSIPELKENVQILGPEWNSTLLIEDSDSIPAGLMQYNIVRSRKKDCIIRHFAAGQTWRTDY